MKGSIPPPVPSNPSQNLTKALRHKARPLQALDKHGTGDKTTCFRSVLTIVNTDISDERDYTITIENSKGVVESTIKLRVSPNNFCLNY